MLLLPLDWQVFFRELGEGSAAFGLFELGERGEQPVLLLHAVSDTTVPQEPALRTRLEWHKEVQVVRLVITMQETRPQMESPVISLHMQPERERYQLRVTENDTSLSFETFLNPCGSEDRDILSKLIQVPALSISLVQSGYVLWGKQFPWQEPFRDAILSLLAETSLQSPTDQKVWEEAKAQVMSNHSI